MTRLCLRYDTATAQPLLPKYISTVDSGNMAGHLLVVKQWSAERLVAGSVPVHAREGVLDTLAQLSREISAVKVVAIPAGGVTIAQLQDSVNVAIDTVKKSRCASLREWDDCLHSLQAHLRDAEDVLNALCLDPAAALRLSDCRQWMALSLTHVAEMQRDLPLLQSSEEQSPWLRRKAAVGAQCAALFDAMEFGFLFDAQRKGPCDAQTTDQHRRTRSHRRTVSRCLPLFPSFSLSPSLCRLRSPYHTPTCTRRPNARRRRYQEGVRSANAAQRRDVASSEAVCRQPRVIASSATLRGPAPLDPRPTRASSRVPAAAPSLSSADAPPVVSRGCAVRALQLFCIGYSCAEGRVDRYHYDLLASESRLASFIAIAKGEVSQEHWFRLGRQLTAVSGGQALISWTASMFEYLMPLLVMRSYDNTLLHETYAAVVHRQVEYGRIQSVPWGISEAGYNARDLQMSYQYGPFGVPGLGLKRGLSEDLVVSPYSTMLAAMVDPITALSNLKSLETLQAFSKYGFYESIDWTLKRLPNKARTQPSTPQHSAAQRTSPLPGRLSHHYPCASSACMCTCVCV